LIPFTNLPLKYQVSIWTVRFGVFKELSFLCILLEVLWRYFWGSLWYWRYLCGTSEPELGEEI